MNIPQRFEPSSEQVFYEQRHSNNRFYLSDIEKDDDDKTRQIIIMDELDSDNGSDIAITHLNELQKPFTYEQNFRPIIEGWIRKKTLNCIYQQRYFVLTPTRLCYYTNQTKTQPKGCFNLISLLKYNISLAIEQMTIKLKLSPDTHLQEFQNRYILQMEFSSKDKLVQWFEQLDRVIKQLLIKRSLFGLQMIDMYPQITMDSLIQVNQKIASQYNHNFWNKIDISLAELCSYCSHLDILLFRSKSSGSYFSRFLMRSYYDHVALIIRSQHHEIFVFEAIESRGVTILDLETFLKINQQNYQQVAFRKLIVDQSKQEQKPGYYKGISLDRLENYLNSLLGKKYQLSLSKLFFDQTVYDVSRESFYSSAKKNQRLNYIEATNPMENKNGIQTENQADLPQKRQQKTFFCSELIANVYLKFGLIREGRPREFWPKDFEENEIKFRQNTTFSPIMNVCFK